jgi:hypothetical protein
VDRLRSSARLPEYYVAREFSIGVGTHRPTTNIVMSTDLDMVRGVMEQMNLTPTPRWPEDDPKIIEVWL